MQVLVLVDQPTYHALRASEAPASKFSHDRHIFQFAHECLRKGFDVICTSMQEDWRTREYQRLSSVYPLWSCVTRLGYGDISPDIVASVFPEALNIRAQFPHAKIVSIHAAVHWAESPETFSAHYVHDVITAIRHNTDFILTQNDRMKSLLEATYGLLAGWRYPERVIVCPLSIVEEEKKRHFDRILARETMGLIDGDIAIINSGGIWRWTDFNCFLDSFCNYSNKFPRSKLKLFITGFRQSGNYIHDEYHIETKDIIYNNRHLLGRTIFAENVWSIGSKNVDMYSAGADVGINISQESLEQWQSYRVRFLEYITQGTPVINSTGDAMSSGQLADAMFLVRPGDRAGYMKTLKMIDSNPNDLRAKASAMRNAATEFDSRKTYGETIQRIVDTPRRTDGDTASWGPCVLDRAKDLTRHTVLEDTRRRLADLLLAGV